MLDIQKFIDGLHTYIEQILSPIVARLKAIEDRQPEKGEKGDKGEQGDPGKDGVDGKDGAQGERGERGESGRDGVDGKDGTNGIDGKDGKDGIDGKDADPALVADIVLSKVFASEEFITKMVELASARVLSAIPIPKDGRDGIDGKDADPETIKQLVASAVAEIPTPKDGKDGADGKSISPEELAPLIDELVAKHVTTIPAGKDGADGKDADPDFIRQEVEKAVASIPRPKDGEPGKSITAEDVAPIIEASVAKWEVDFERRAHDLLQSAVDRLPKPKDGEKGDPGNDGFGIESFVQRGDRSVVAIYKRGEETIEQVFTFPAVIDRGVYRAGDDYEKGDGTTYAGSYWIAQKDTNEPPGKSDAWRLAVKRGRDAVSTQIQAMAILTTPCLKSISQQHGLMRKTSLDLLLASKPLSWVWMNFLKKKSSFSRRRQASLASSITILTAFSLRLMPITTCWMTSPSRAICFRLMAIHGRLRNLAPRRFVSSM
jgi:hypothetical protein